jgi:dihydrofolate reductase
MKSKISVIAAIGKNRELGKDNKLLWDIPEDMKRFRTLTSGHPIIMGRKTFESIGRVLPNRTNIIVTRNKQQVISEKKYEGTIIVESLEEAIGVGRKSSGKEEIFIIGGGQIFDQALPRADKLYLTIVDASFDADTFFPEYSMFTKVIGKEEHEFEGFKYVFLTLER